MKEVKLNIVKVMKLYDKNNWQTRDKNVEEQKKLRQFLRVLIVTGYEIKLIDGTINYDIYNVSCSYK